MVEKTNGMIGFKIETKSLKDILKHLQAKGKEEIGDTMSFMKDCIIRVDHRGIWSITIDDNRDLIAHAKVNIDSNTEHGLETYGKGKIPLDIENTLKCLDRFSSGDHVELIYENGLIALRKTNNKLKPPIIVETILAGLQKNSIRNDMLLNLFRKTKKSKNHKDILDFIKKHHSTYIIKNDIATIYNTMSLNNFVELSSIQLKEVVRDGDLLENRKYPFEVKDNKLNITSKPTEVGIIKKISRDIYVKQAKFTGNFIAEYPSQFNAAVKTTKGHVKLYFGEGKPLLLVKSNNLDYGLDMSYIVNPIRIGK